MSGRRGVLKGLYHEYRSAFTGAPCILAFSGISRPSENPETGPMIQATMMPRDVAPMAGVRSGADEAVCRDCEMRWHKGGACYVLPWRGPGRVWESVSEGSYERLDLGDARHVSALRRYPLRYGAWGDPASVPRVFWLEFRHAVKPADWTSYTRQWQDARFQYLKLWTMASVFTPEEAAEAQGRGWRTYRVMGVGDPVQGGEIVCPKTPRAGQLATCITCGLCDGRASRAANICAEAHGARAGRFQKLEVIS